MSPILDRIVRIDLGARRRTSQSWSSVTVARRCNGEAQSAHGISEAGTLAALASSSDPGLSRVSPVEFVMSPILDRIVRTDLGARRRTSQSWSSVTVARRCNGEAQSAHGISEHPPGPENTRRLLGKKRDGRIPLHMAKIALRGDVCGKAVSWELGTTLGW
ncbi:hypothetical protein F2Q69_00058909 [Brassica cretica]|uniref:Uncharacterized protein n=1 Tax=Brassica cretica TaxID=69181 RepID=A0A8S9RFC6_BRACR|nr:hypothetical protein F2Q69_00058909 [Brassica cretica]